MNGSIHVGLAALGAAIGVGLIGMGASEAVGRNPDASTKILVQSILAIAFAETGEDGNLPLSPESRRRVSARMSISGSPGAGNFGSCLHGRSRWD